ncbi:1-acyl-sn-glycerol-3-phosphate acyltransferase [Loktanella sp. SALINAS62]|uniref:1-acyl-sn-glycerol-3-phosphate acyltransferase n=1 Tax=Loktanella sp. SALINAS62 TaxID=2706124 RepID=UPI001B8CC9EF|nr:1-acyl-sn-glycerol-3-phosphate acyltransferase [Loktanella sp. SALINAS62]MBS1301343.1 glycerol-3-phosphate acyltransferase [Loktanella sp. SALINAS62]
MTQPVTLPLWAFWLILIFAAVTFASHFLFPSVRWFFRKRAERVIARLNERLARPIEPFKLARRHDMIQRLIYDPEVTAAIVEHATEHNVPENVAFEKAQKYAREIVPSFSATAYFSFGMRLARWLSNSLYRVRIATFPRQELASLDPNATIIFVMNHRSNMDYVLVTYLVSRAGALSYAVGEWARVWPLSGLIRALGAYFIRRRSGGNLYRRVLARYVQMATDGGVTQAIFPEGGLSLTGEVREPKLGLLSYIVGNYRPGDRDVIFIPVGLNYDRTIEDQFLIRAYKRGNRRFRPPNRAIVSGVASHLWQRVTGRFDTFGTASVGFGQPLELSLFLDTVTGDPTKAVATELMDRVRQVVPVLATPLIARLLLETPGLSRDNLLDRTRACLSALEEQDMPLPQRSPDVLVDDTLTRLIGRGLLRETDQGLEITPTGAEVLPYYANSIAHHFPELPST